jgi:hypothetical protein
VSLPSKRWLLLQHLLRVWGGQFPPECPGQFRPEWVVSLRRNGVVTFIRISTIEPENFKAYVQINEMYINEILDFVSKYISQNEIPPKKINITTREIKLSLREVALICHYEGRPVTRTNGNIIANEYSHNSGDALFNHYTRYQSKANRIGTEGSPKKNSNKVKLFESVLSYFENNEEIKSKISEDLNDLKTAIIKNQ